MDKRLALLAIRLLCREPLYAAIFSSCRWQVRYPSRIPADPIGTLRHLLTGSPNLHPCKLRKIAA